jgi:ferredoxin
MNQINKTELIRKVKDMKEQYTHSFRCEGSVDCMYCHKKIINNIPKICSYDSDYNRALSNVIKLLENYEST